MITGRNLLWLIPLILIVTFPLWKIPAASFLAPRGGLDRDIIHKRTSRYNFVMTSVNILQHEDERQNAIIRAAKARTSKRPNEYILDDVDADIVGGDGKITNILARTGNYNVVRQRLKLRDDVVITSTTDKYTLSTSLLYYDSNEQSVYCPKPTKVQGNGIHIRGSRFNYDITNEIYTVAGRVYCILEGYDGT